MGKFLIYTKNIKTQKGFTIVEMMVSVVVFTLVMTMAIGVVVILLNSNKHVQSTSMSIGFVDTVLEKMFREVSAGTTYRCDDGSVFYAYINEDENSDNLPNGQKNKLEDEQTCADFKETLVFEGVDGNSNTPDDQIIYIFHENTIKRSDNGGDSFETLIGDNVVIEDFKIKVVGSDISIERQPAVFVSIRGYVQGKEGERAVFTPQTMITQRLDPSILRD